MMKLSTMRVVTDTLNDAWESPLADQILSLWSHDKGNAKFLRASANFIFTFQKNGEDYYLRFNHSAERSIDLVSAEVDFVNHLAAKGINVARPVPSTSGRFVEKLTLPLGTFHAVVFRGLPGSQLEIENLPPEMFVQWGKALGEIHNASQSYSAQGRQTWRDHLDMVLKELPQKELKARGVVNQLVEKLTQFPVNGSNFGMVHFDFELDNIVWNGTEAGIIDFDDCAYYWFAADIAFALRDLFGNNPKRVDFQDLSFQSFILGYRLVRRISQADIEQIPVFLQLHNLILYTRLKRALGTKGAPDDPGWLVDLRKKLSLKMQSYQESFA